MKGHCTVDEKIWRRWSRKNNPQNTNQIAKALDITEPEVEASVTLSMQSRYDQEPMRWVDFS